jgi:hypothetical protein
MSITALTAIANTLCTKDQGVIDLIEHVEDTSEAQTTTTNSLRRMHIIFKNGYKLSIIQGKYAYSDDDTFEIGIFTEAGNLTADLFGGDDNDTVKGYCTLEEVSYYMKKIAYL